GQATSPQLQTADALPTRSQARLDNRPLPGGRPTTSLLSNEPGHAPAARPRPLPPRAPACPATAWPENLAVDRARAAGWRRARGPGPGQSAGPSAFTRSAT